MTLSKWYNFNKYVLDGDIEFTVYSCTGKKVGTFYTEDIEEAADSTIFGLFEVMKVSTNDNLDALCVELKEPTIHDGCESCVHFDPEESCIHFDSEESCDICNKCRGTASYDSAEYNHKPDMFTEIPDYSKHEAQR